MDMLQIKKKTKKTKEKKKCVRNLRKQRGRNSEIK